MWIKEQLSKFYRFLRIMFNFVKLNWWWLLLTSLIVLCTIVFFTPYSDKLVQWAKILTDVITPFSLFLGIILGYPLLKKKIMEQYVMKQFEMRDTANREVRHKVIELLDKYPVKYISQRLTAEYIEKALSGITCLL